jgi:hypothetical protein
MLLLVFSGNQSSRHASGLAGSTIRLSHCDPAQRSTPGPCRIIPIRIVYLWKTSAPADDAFQD